MNQIQLNWKMNLEKEYFEADIKNENGDEQKQNFNCFLNIYAVSAWKSKAFFWSMWQTIYKSMKKSSILVINAENNLQN